MKARLPQGYGKQSPSDMMRQVQEMQTAVQNKQAEIEETEYSVNAAGDMIKIVIKGDYQITSVNIKPEIVQPDDVEMLEDMLAAAFNEAVRHVKEIADKEIEEVSSKFNLPNLPGLM